ncbi:MAG: pyridoxamine 5'-phosphate oxidase family protein [Opitutus sp.]|nr:pyridoxamine 5'-phosphate oxidase family protein [Opitutus sp.]MCS6277009.1 pyridoxamine 5'-phosphate oxidase family protein [Opitutus sp.]MCS6299943.1 pyridoxamine 5'-phosphate oxidase family protein [Opitutus sp.]
MFSPRSNGEKMAQSLYSTTKRALAFYDKQMLDSLNQAMKDFILRQEMVFIATSDASGECDSSFRAGLPGFIRVLDEKTLIYPEYRGNGVMASIGNIMENNHIGMMFIDFFESTVGLHVNGTAQILENDQLLVLTNLPDSVLSDLKAKGVRKPERWIKVSVLEAYIHCSKHVPLLAKLDKKIHWGTDNSIHKGGDYFGVNG